MNVPHAVFLFACVATVSSASAEPGNLILLDDGIKPLVMFPDTPAGRIAQAFIAAFNSGDEDKMRVFSEHERSKSSLESSSMKDRLEQYRELYGDWGQLEVRKVEAHDERNLTVTVKPDRGFSGRGNR